MSSKMEMEIRKLICDKSIYIFFIGLVALSLLISLSIAISLGGEIARGYIMIRSLVLLQGINLPILITFFTIRIFSLELECGVVDYLIIHNVINIRIYIYKSMIALFLIVCSFIFMGASAFFVESIFKFDLNDITFQVLTSTVIFKSDSLNWDIMCLYVNQILGCYFLFELFLMFLIIIGNYMKAAIGTIAMIAVFDLIEYMTVGNITREIIKIIPFNAEYTWRSLSFFEAGNITYGLFLFSILLFSFNYIILRKKISKIRTENMC